MNISANRFVRQQLQATLDAEREVVRLYAKTCFLTMQVLHGNLSGLEWLDQLENSLYRAERKLQLSRAALQRIGVAGSGLAGLGDQERFELFERHFGDTDVSARLPDSLLGAEDLRDMLNDIAGPVYAESPG